MDLYDKNALQCSNVTTRNYSTSFSFGIRLFRRKYRPPIHAIYGFVRFADEIVDTFEGTDKKALFERFKSDTWDAIEKGISLNPIMHSFQLTVNNFHIDHDLIRAFLRSMEMDIYHNHYDRDMLKEYIYGSAEVVGLMCLKVFYWDDKEQYEALVYPARKLGEAFQKVNFLRDIKADYAIRGRKYFPAVDIHNFDDRAKKQIEIEIREDFKEAYPGVAKLRKDIRMGILLAFLYYKKLLLKIEKSSADKILGKRFRISLFRKGYLLVVAALKHYLNIL